MRINLDETQLEAIKDILSKLTKSFNGFSQSVKDLTTSINKLTEKLEKKE